MTWQPYKIFSTCLDFQQTQLKVKIIHCEILGKLWEVIGVDMLTLNNKNYLYIVYYHSKFPVVKREKTYLLTA